MLTASEMAKRSIAKQKEKYGDKWAEEMSRRGKNGGAGKHKNKTQNNGQP